MHSARRRTLKLNQPINNIEIQKSESEDDEPAPPTARFIRRFDFEEVPSLVFSREQLESKMDKAAANILQLVYHYAVADFEHKNHRLKIEARIRAGDYSSGPVLSLVRMVKRLIQER